MVLAHRRVIVMLSLGDQVLSSDCSGMSFGSIRIDCRNNANNKQVGLRLSARISGDRFSSPSTIAAVHQSPQQEYQIGILVSRHVTVEYSDTEEGVFESPVREAVAWVGGEEAV